MQSHDDVRKEEQTQEETPHDEREGGMTTAAEDDLGDRFGNRAWEVVLAIVFRRR